MTIGKIVRDRPVPFLYGWMLITLAALWLLPPILQDQDYHHFADQREWLGIPHFWDVVSNAAFLVVGAIGLLRLRLRHSATTLVLFGGIFLTGIGSSYYHLTPNDGTLLWDRLPMTLGFAAIFSAVVQERVDEKAGAMLLWPLLAIGVFSLLLWHWTGDLRLYAWAQFFPLITVILVLILFPPKYTGTRYWIAAAVLYALAKLLEHFDRQVYVFLGALSGHTLKHLAAAAACFAILRVFLVRQPLDTQEKPRK